MFCHIWNDLIHASNLRKDKIEGVKFICDRYKKWQEILKKENSLLSEAEVKGLIGELYILQKYLISAYGEKASINAWTGPKGAPQDFIFEQIWYEVKVVSSSKQVVTISSIDQLDNVNEGRLVVIKINKTSEEDSLSLTLNKLYSDLYFSLKSTPLCEAVSDLVAQLGYYNREEYDKYTYKVEDIFWYRVDSMFPCLRKKHLPSSIGGIKYELLLPSIEAWINEGE